MKKATRSEILNELLEQVSKLVPAGAGFHYFIEYNSVYGGYRLVKVKDESGAHYGCFGGNGTEGRVKYAAMVLKLRTIISTATAAAPAEKTMAELLQELEFTKASEYFDYIVDSIVNGQRQQARELIAALPKDQKKAAHRYYDMEEGAGDQAQEAQKMILEAL